MEIVRTGAVIQMYNLGGGEKYVKCEIPSTVILRLLGILKIPKMRNIINSNTNIVGYIEKEIKRNNTKRRNILNL